MAVSSTRRPERAQDFVLASWRLFRLAPRSALALWALGVANAILLQRGAADAIPQLAKGALGAPALGRMAAALAMGWGADCVLKALWARLAWQGLGGEATGLPLLWRRLRGAWAGTGLLVAYATLAAAALTWPHLVEVVARLEHPTWAAAASLLLSLGAAWVGLRSALGVPAAAVDHLGGPASWRASWALTRGRLWPLGLLLPLPSLTGLLVGRLAAALLPGIEPGELWPVLLGAAAEVSLAGLPGTLFWAWRPASDAA